MPYDEYLREIAQDTRRLQIVRTLAKQLLEARDALRKSAKHCTVGGAQMDPGPCEHCVNTLEDLNGE